MTDARDREDALDARIREAAQAQYNPPPAVPRDAIWAGIQEGRAAADRSDVIALPARRPSVARWAAWITGVAALLAVGIGIGRFSSPEAPGTVVGTSPSSTGSTGSTVALDVATLNHLSRAEALLTAFRAEGVSPEFTGLVAELLTSTRLLLDTRAVSDPRTRLLLEDLELILVQLMGLEAADGVERDLINDGLETRQVLPRLRTAIPAGAPLLGAS